MDNNFKMKNMKVYKMSLTTLSPIFIGSGEVLNKSSYFSSDKEVNVIDEEKLIKALYSRRGLFEEFISDCSSGNFSLTTFLDDRLPHYKKMDIAKYKLISHSNILTNNIFKGRVVKKLNDINVFIKSSEGKPYIPGSSIKGAIRTALIASEIRKNKDRYINYFNSKKNLKELKDLEDKALSNISNEILNNTNFQFTDDDYKYFKDRPNLLFKHLIISDSDEVPLEKLFVGKQHDFTTKGNKVNELPIFMEFIKPLTTFYFTISIDKTIVDYFDMTAIEKKLNTYFRQYFNSIEALHTLFVNSNKDKKYTLWSIEENHKPNILLGGHDGYFAKNIIYSLCKFKDTGVDKQKIIDLLKKHFTKHDHIKHDNIMSPRTMKLTMFNNELYNIGVCNIKVEKELC